MKLLFTIRRTAFWAAFFMLSTPIFAMQKTKTDSTVKPGTQVQVGFKAYFARCNDATRLILQNLPHYSPMARSLARCASISASKAQAIVDELVLNLNVRAENILSTNLRDAARGKCQLGERPWLEELLKHLQQIIEFGYICAPGKTAFMGGITPFYIHVALMHSINFKKNSTLFLPYKKNISEDGASYALIKSGLMKKIAEIKESITGIKQLVATKHENRHEAVAAMTDHLANSLSDSFAKIAANDALTLLKNDFLNPQNERIQNPFLLLGHQNMTALDSQKLRNASTLCLAMRYLADYLDSCIADQYPTGNKYKKALKLNYQVYFLLAQLPLLLLLYSNKFGTYAFFTIVSGFFCSAAYIYKTTLGGGLYPRTTIAMSQFRERLIQFSHSCDKFITSAQRILESRVQLNAQQHPTGAMMEIWNRISE